MLGAILAIDGAHIQTEVSLNEARVHRSAVGIGGSMVLIQTAIHRVYWSWVVGKVKPKAYKNTLSYTLELISQPITKRKKWQNWTQDQSNKVVWYADKEGPFPKLRNLHLSLHMHVVTGSCWLCFLFNRELIFFLGHMPGFSLLLFVVLGGVSFWRQGHTILQFIIVYGYKFES